MPDDLTQIDETTPGAHDDEPHATTGLSRQLNWLRAGVLGANDGIVSVAAVVIGVAEEVALIWLPSTYRSAIGFLAIFLFLTFRAQGLMGQR